MANVNKSLGEMVQLRNCFVDDENIHQGSLNGTHIGGIEQYKLSCESLGERFGDRGDLFPDRY